MINPVKIVSFKTLYTVTVKFGYSYIQYLIEIPYFTPLLHFVKILHENISVNFMSFYGIIIEQKTFK